LLIVDSKLTLLLKPKNLPNDAMTQQHEQTTQTATMVSSTTVSLSIYPICNSPNHFCVAAKEKKVCVPLFLLLIVVSVSHVVSKRPKLPIDSTRHHKTQKTTKQR